MPTSSFPGSPRLLKGGLVLIDPDGGRPTRHRAAVQPGHAHAHAAGQGRRQRQRRTAPRRCASRAHRSRRSSSTPRSTPTDQLELATTAVPPRSASTRTSRRWRPSSTRPARSCWPTTPSPGAARWRSCRWAPPHALRVEQDTGSCRSGSPTSPSPRRRSTPHLNPIRAKVSLGMRVLSVDDLGFDHQGRQPLHGATCSRRNGSPPHRARARPCARSASTGLGMTAERELPADQPVRCVTEVATYGSRRRTRGRVPAPPLRAPARALRAADRALVTEGDRLDNITAAHLGDPEQFWRICDANRAMRPDELTRGLGRRLRITLPDGIPGVVDG